MGTSAGRERELAGPSGTPETAWTRLRGRRVPAKNGVELKLHQSPIKAPLSPNPEEMTGALLFVTSFICGKVRSE